MITHGMAAAGAQKVGGFSDPHQHSRTGRGGGLEELGALQGMVQLGRKRKVAERRWDESGPFPEPVGGTLGYP